ncbi:hypothetical protein V8F06_013891 [Rhypophila decipiens]
MAEPRTGAQRQHSSMIRHSVDASASIPKDNCPPGKPGEVENSQNEELEIGPQQSYARVLGTATWVPQTYNPDTYDPDGRLPGTPEPEPYDAETYSSWGQKHFGEEWYKLRETMLRESNTFCLLDPVYLERQRALRVMEHKIDGRPFRPAFRMLDKGWQRLWSRLSKVLPRVQPPTPASSVANDGDGDTNLSGSSTYLFFKDPWEILEYERQHFKWSEEHYQFERIFLKEERIDSTRATYEDLNRATYEEEEVFGQREKELKIRYEPGTALTLAEYYRRTKHLSLRAEGWTQEQIDAEDRSADAAAQIGDDFDQEVMNWRFYFWDLSGLTREEQDRLSRIHGSYKRPANPLLRAPKERIPPPKSQEEMNRLFSYCDWILTREEQTELASMYGFGVKADTDRRADGRVAPPAKHAPAYDNRVTKSAPQSRSYIAARSRRFAPTSTEPPPRPQTRYLSIPDASEEVNDKAQVIRQGQKQRKKGRGSRRLAGQLPEYGLLRTGTK